MTSAPVDLFAPGYLADPYPTYRWLRASDPVHHLGGDYWVVSRYHDVLRVLRNPTGMSSALGYRGMIGDASTRLAARSDQPVDVADTGIGMIQQAFNGLRVLISSDPPDHTRLRRLVSREFTPRSIAAMEPRVQTVCERLIAELLDARVDGCVDVWEHLSYPLPTMVIAELLGIEPERRADFKRWSDAVVNDMSLGGGGDISRGAIHALEMFQYFETMIAARRKSPGSDLISILVTRPPEGDEPLSTAELVAFCVLLLIAGNETTTNLLGNFFEAMHDFPDEQSIVRADPSLVPAVVEETLRYDSPIQGIWRGLRQPAEVGGVELPQEARVMVLFASANRDEAVFGEDAEVFRAQRSPRDHIAFGNGIHLCLGAALARLEARVAISTLLARTSWFERAGEPVRALSPVLRGVRSQRLRL